MLLREGSAPTLVLRLLGSCISSLDLRRSPHSLYANDWEPCCLKACGFLVLTSEVEGCAFGSLFLTSTVPDKKPAVTHPVVSPNVMSSFSLTAWEIVLGS